MIAFNPLAGELQEKGSSNLIKFDPLSGKFVYAVGDGDQSLYLRPDAVSVYHRPDGTSLYLRP